MSNLNKAVEAFSKVNSTVVGDEEKGIVIERGESYFALSLSDALAAMEKGEGAMMDAIEEKAVDLGEDFEF